MKPCPGCPNPRPPVPSDGPVPCRLLLIGEAPSYSEDKDGCVFTGKTGIELNNTYLPILGLPRSLVHIANARWCSNPTYDNPTLEEAARCSAFHLSALLQRVKPEVIVPMGVVACSLFEDNFSINLEHGIPRPGKYGPWSGILYPMFHPSISLHSGMAGYMIPLMADFDELGKLLKRLDRGEFEYPMDEIPEPDYRVCLTRMDVAHYFMRWYESLGHPIACDTEATPDGKVYCITFSSYPGTGRLIYADNQDAMEALRYQFGGTEKPPLDPNPELIFHNYLYDVKMFDQLGLPIHRFADTMVRAYNLCLGGGVDDEGESRAGRGSLGLKVLAYRHCAMKMTTFKETVYPYSTPKMLEYLWRAESLFYPGQYPKETCECGHKNTQHEARGKTSRLTGPCTCGCTKFKTKKKPKTTTESKLVDLLHRKTINLIEALESRTDPDLDPWKRLKAWHPHDIEMLLDYCGPWPIPSISHVPERELLNYAVRDPDATLRLHQKLSRCSPWIFY